MHHNSYNLRHNYFENKKNSLINGINKVYLWNKLHEETSPYDYCYHHFFLRRLIRPLANQMRRIFHYSIVGCIENIHCYNIFCFRQFQVYIWLKSTILPYCFPRYNLCLTLTDILIAQLSYFEIVIHCRWRAVMVTSIFSLLQRSAWRNNILNIWYFETRVHYSYSCIIKDFF